MDLQPFNARLERFFSEVAVIQHYQRLTARVARQTIADIQARDKDLAELDAEAQKVLGMRVEVFSFHSPYTGAIHPYSHKTLSPPEAAWLVHLHKNKQYQWLFVEAYELFEDFVVSLYELVRVDFAQFRLPKDQDSSMTAAELKKKVQLIMNRFRQQLPELAKIEIENQSHTNLRLHTCMAEKFRHVIVHKNGKTGDAALMTDQILKWANLYGDKAREPAARAEIGRYIGEGKVAGVIELVEVPVFKASWLSMDINKHENLVNALMAHALVMAQSLVDHLGKT